MALVDRLHAILDRDGPVVRAAAGRLVLLYLPTYSPWLNPIEPKWLHGKRNVAEPDRVLGDRDVLDR